MNVGAVVVTYHPDPDALIRLVALLSRQVDSILVVDNTPAQTIGSNSPEPSGCAVLRFGENRGLATAHNAGINWAREQRFDYVLLLDQDSLPAPDMVERLHAAADRLTRTGVAVAVVGPRYMDPRTGRYAGAIRVGAMRVKREFCRQNSTTETLISDSLISSGSLLRLAAVDRVGGFDDSLFIDYVDHEWCLRARASGYVNYIICDAGLLHRIGSRIVNYWLGRWRAFPDHPPHRHYYMLRNLIVLARRPHIPTSWLISNFAILIPILVVALLILPHRLRRVGLILRAVRDGVRGRTGPLAG